MMKSVIVFYISVPTYVTNLAKMYTLESTRVLITQWLDFQAESRWFGPRVGNVLRRKKMAFLLI